MIILSTNYLGIAIDIFNCIFLERQKLTAVRKTYTYSKKQPIQGNNNYCKDLFLKYYHTV